MKRSKTMKMGALFVAAALVSLPARAQQKNFQATWQEILHQDLPLLGHRNWILIVDSAYPLQTSPGVETIETNSPPVEVVREVLKEVDASIHVRPVLFMDAELPFVPEEEAPGVTKYKQQLAAVLNKRPVTALPHEQLIRNIDEAGKTFHILVLKTNLTVPYSSVFVQLNCKYWGDAAEARLRVRMKARQMH